MFATRLFVVVLLALSVVGVSAGPAVARAPDGGARAMWVWGEPAGADVVAWASSHDVTDVFVSVPTDVEAELPRLTDLKDRATAAGIRVSALGGDPGWALDSAAALDWQRAALGTGLFWRAHVDIEPYLLPEWDTDRAGTVAGFLETLTSLQDDDSRSLELDVPFWYEDVAAPGGNLADAVLARVDAVTVMSYRDTATGSDSMTSVGADMIARGEDAGKPVRLGAETEAVPDCTRCTFHEEGAAAMQTVLSRVDSAMAGSSSYAGIAVNHYSSWRNL